MISHVLALVSLLALGGHTPASGPDTSLIVSTKWLAAHLNDPKVVVIAVGHDGMGQDFAVGHIKGARHLDYNAIGRKVNDVNLELITPDSIKNLFEPLGVSDDSHIIITGMPLMATRVFFTLDYVGVKHLSILAGGFPAWKAEGGPIETGAAKPRVRGHLTPHPRPEIVASADYVLAHIGKAGTSFIDTRAEGEYLGAEVHRGIPSSGHIDGARRLEWQDMFTDSDEFTPKDVATLREMWAHYAAPTDTVVTYCYIGYRASGSYFMSRYLGYIAKLYDGSYDEWGQKNLPTVKTVTPPRQ